jgi:hypothetical protein
MPTLRFFKMKKVDFQRSCSLYFLLLIPPRQAMTMLEATADANNRNAYDLAIADYRTNMNRIAGPEAAFVKESQLSVRNDVPSPQSEATRLH